MLICLSVVRTSTTFLSKIFQILIKIYDSCVLEGKRFPACWYNPNSLLQWQQTEWNKIRDQCLTLMLAYVCQLVLNWNFSRAGVSLVLKVFICPWIKSIKLMKRSITKVRNVYHQGTMNVCKKHTMPIYVIRVWDIRVRNKDKLNNSGHILVIVF